MVTLNNITAVQEKGYAITTFGVGEEFDEEFLIRVADNSRGEYHYCPPTPTRSQTVSSKRSVRFAGNRRHGYVYGGTRSKAGLSYRKSIWYAHR